MMFIYDKNNRAITQARGTGFVPEKILERQDLEKWVMDNPQAILGEDLYIVTNEFDGFKGTQERLDILALDKDEKLVVIELKRDDSGKYVDLQALRYAAYCSTLNFNDVVRLNLEYRNKNKSESERVSEDDVRELIKEFVEDDEDFEIDNKPRIMLVSKEFQKEVTSTVLWLSNFDVDISCIKLTPYTIDNDRIGIVSNIIIPVPDVKDYQIQIESKKKVVDLTTTQEEYLEFYREVIKGFGRRVGLSPVDLPMAKPKNYNQIPTGYGGVHFEWVFRGKPRSNFTVGIDFERGNKAENMKDLKALEKQKDELEKDLGLNKELGEQLIFTEVGEKWARMYIQKNTGQITGELKEWAIEMMARLYTVCMPKLDIIFK